MGANRRRKHRGARRRWPRPRARWPSFVPSALCAASKAHASNGIAAHQRTASEVGSVDRIGPTAVRNTVEQTAREGPCPACGVVSGAAKDRPLVLIKDHPFRVRRRSCGGAKRRAGVPGGAVSARTVHPPSPPTRSGREPGSPTGCRTSWPPPRRATGPCPMWPGSTACRGRLRTRALTAAGARWLPEPAVHPRTGRDQTRQQTRPGGPRWQQAALYGGNLALTTAPQADIAPNPTRHRTAMPQPETVITLGLAVQLHITEQYATGTNDTHSSLSSQFCCLSLPLDSTTPHSAAEKVPLTRENDVGLSGLEPLTSALSGQRSNRLSYRPAGAPRRQR